MRWLVSTFALTWALTGCSTPATIGGGDEGAAAPVQPVTAADSTAGNTTRVCRREQIIGSLMTKKVCRTRTEIEADRQSATEAMGEITRPSARLPGGTN